MQINEKENELPLLSIFSSILTCKHYFGHCSFREVLFGANNVEILVYSKPQKTDEDKLHKMQWPNIKWSVFTNSFMLNGALLINHTICVYIAYTLIFSRQSHCRLYLWSNHCDVTPFSRMKSVLAIAFLLCKCYMQQNVFVKMCPLLYTCYMNVFPVLPKI